MVCDKVRCEVRLVYKKHTPPPRNGGEITTNTIFHKHFQTIEVRWEARLDCVLYCLRTNSRGGVNPFSHRVNISRHESQRNKGRKSTRSVWIEGMCQMVPIVYIA